MTFKSAILDKRVRISSWTKSLLRANVDYFPSYEIVQNSDRGAAWEPDLRHVKGAGALHIMELFLQKYLV